MMMKNSLSFFFLFISIAVTTLCDCYAFTTTTTTTQKNHHHHAKNHAKNNRKTNLLSLKASSRSDIEDESSSSSSARLRKAKVLLEQLSLEDPVESSSSSATTTTATKTTTATTSDKTNKKDSSSSSSSSSPSILDDLQVVPDNFWTNDHLQEPTNTHGADKSTSDSVVTRWASGVKVAEPLVKYDPIAAEKLWFRRPTKWIVRNIQIALPLSLWFVGIISDYIFAQNNKIQNKKKSTTTGSSSVVDSGSTDNNNDDETTMITSKQRRIRAKELTRKISNLGPAIIKGGQALASRPDLLPSEYLEELQKLQDDVPRFQNDVAFRTVEKELNCKFNEVFELIVDEPIAAASIGQVYKARLKANGDVVALKIQRPGCEEIIALDLYVLRWWSGKYNQIFQLLQRDIDLQSIIDDFGTLIYREIDYVAEAANAQRFQELYAGVKDVYVPKIYSDLTTQRVLTMEWVDGIRLSDTETLRQYNLNESKLINTLVQCSLKQILENGFFHADPHAGNLLACMDGRLCYLDFGMMSYAARDQRNGFLLAVVHIVNRDWYELTRLYQKLGFIPQDEDVQPIILALENAMPDVLNSDITELNFKNVINQLGDIMYTYPFSLPPFYIAIIRCLGVLEGLAIQVDPQARIISKAYPYVASRVLTDPQDELQEALRRLALTSDGTSVRWDRLESLLDEAKESNGYNVAAAIDILTDYLIKPENGLDPNASDQLLAEVAEQIVNAADSLGSDSAHYLFQAVKALTINDEVAAVKAFRSLQDIIETLASSAASSETATPGEDGSGVKNPNLGSVKQKVGDDLKDVLPELKPSMRRFWRIVSLLGGTSDGSGGGEMDGGEDASTTTDPAKFVPVLRKLVQEPKIQQTANEILARLWERALSRGLRAAFGLPPPVFGIVSPTSTVTEDNK